MPAFVEFVPIEKLRVGSLSPHLRWREHVSLEDADGNRKLQRHSDEIPSETLVVEPRRRCGGVGKPVEWDVFQHRVDGDGLLGITFVVGPALKLLVDPHRLPNWRVGKTVPERLWASPLDGRIAGGIRRIPLQLSKGGLFFRGIAPWRPR